MPNQALKLPEFDGQPVEPSPVTIADRRVGGDQPVLVIAEAGVNHNGCVETALRLVDAAADAGADAVKFQLFHAEALASAAALPADYQRDAATGDSQRDMLARLELMPKDFAAIKAHCDRRSILFVGTPFDESMVETLVALDAAAIKIASTDLTNAPLLGAATVTGLPMIVSLGAATAAEIHAQIGPLQSSAVGSRIVLMHCVSCYPTPIASLNLRAIGTLRTAFALPCGLSDHTVSIETGAWAAAAGAAAVEKHLTLDRGAAGPDHAMSLEPLQLAEYIVKLRAVEVSLGSGAIGMSEIEVDVRRAARRSVVAAVDIAVGAVLSSEMLVLKRPGTGIAPTDMAQLIGRRTARRVSRDTVFAWDMVE